jgi:hypothetical protein
MRAYMTNEPSRIEPGKQSNHLPSTTIGWTTKTYGGGDDHRRHTSESGMKRWNGNDGHSIVCERDRHPLRSRRAIGLGGLGLNPGSVSVKENVSPIEEPGKIRR